MLLCFILYLDTESLASNSQVLGLQAWATKPSHSKDATQGFMHAQQALYQLNWLLLLAGGPVFLWDSILLGSPCNPSATA